MSVSRDTIKIKELGARLEQLEYRAPEDGAKGGRSSYAYLRDTNRLLYVQVAEAKSGQVPDVRVPFGVSPPYKNEVEKSRKNVELSIDNPETQQIFKDFDEWNIKKIAACSKLLFGKVVSEEKVRAKYTPSLKVNEPTGENKTAFPPLLRTKMNTEEGAFCVKVFNASNGPDGQTVMTKGTWQDVNKKKANVLPIVRYGGLWFSAIGYGPSWELASIAMYPGASQDEEFAFVWDGDDKPVVDFKAKPQVLAPTPAPAPPVPAPALAPAPATESYEFKMDTTD